MKQAEPLIPILTEETCQRLFSKNWTFREEGLKWLENECKKPRNVKFDD